jgi:hypothetical protein
MIAAKTLSLQVSDLSGQASQWARGISREATIGELTDGLAGALDLPHQDGSGRPLRYSVRTDAGEALNPSDVVGDVLEPEARITLSPSVTAG